MRLVTITGLVCFIGGVVVMLCASHLSLPEDMPPQQPFGMWEKVSFAGLLLGVVGIVAMLVSHGRCDACGRELERRHTKKEA